MNELKTHIQNRIKECMRNGDKFERDTLRTVLGESQSKNLNYTDEDIVKILKKSKQSCVENMKLMSSDVDTSKIKEEIEIYDKYIPQSISIAQIVDLIKCQSDLLSNVLNSKSDGQATGLVISYAKKNDLVVDGKDVSVAVNTVRTDG